MSTTTPLPRPQAPAPEPDAPSSADAATDDLDLARVDAFASRLLDTLDAACLALMTSIGHQTGLFDVMATLPPSTSQQIADAASLHERYVREWLAATTVARVVEHDPHGQTYWLPAEHAALLTRDAGPDNLAHLMQYVPLLAGVEAEVVRAFREGGGVGYDAFPTFHRVMAEESATVQDAALVSEILPLVPGLVDRLGEGITVADIGCGSGHAVNLMARAFPASAFVGYDMSAEGVAVGRAEAAAWGLTNARFEVLDVARLDVTAAFDLVTAFDSIHDQADPAGVLAAIARSLREGGTFLMVDIKASSHLHDNLDLPLGTFLYTISCMHCMTVSLAQGGAGLGTCWGEQTARRMLAEAGLGSCTVKDLPTDPFNSYYVATAG